MECFREIPQISSPPASRQGYYHGPPFCKSIPFGTIPIGFWILQRTLNKMIKSTLNHPNQPLHPWIAAWTGTQSPIFVTKHLAFFFLERSQGVFFAESSKPGTLRTSIQSAVSTTRTWACSKSTRGSTSTGNSYSRFPRRLTAASREKSERVSSTKGTCCRWRSSYASLASSSSTSWTWSIRCMLWVPSDSEDITGWTCSSEDIKLRVFWIRASVSNSTDQLTLWLRTLNLVIDEFFG